MIAELEKTLGTSLLVRSRDGSRPSASGQRIAAKIETLRESWSELTAASGHRFRRHFRYWSLGGIPPATPDSPTAKILARIVANWNRNFTTPLYLQPGLADALYEGLELRRFDAILVDAPPPAKQFRSREVHRSQLGFFMQTDAEPRNAADGLAMIRERLLHGHLVLPTRAAGLRQVDEDILQHLIGEDWDSRVRFTEVDSIPVAVELIANYGYCSILPRTLPVTTANLRVIPLPDRFAVSLKLVWMEGHRGEKIVGQLLEVLHPNGSQG